jgi:glycosidase
MMNLTASHDSPRFSTSVFNPGRYKYRAHARENPDYRIDRPGQRTREIQEMILVNQFTYVGAPHIWYGDEVGMWGGDDPDPRKPMVWEDLTYEDEATHPMGLSRKVDPVVPDLQLLETYRRLVALRNDNLRLFVDGELTWLHVSDANSTLAYERAWEDERAAVVLNASEDYQEVALEVEPGTWTEAYGGARTTESDGTLTVQVAPLGASVWVREHR